jgi:phage tail protein X
MASTQYTVQDGERWDTIAYKAYGRADLAHIIITANPGIPVTARLEGGTVLEIPILEETAVKTDAELLPPWKRIF